MSSLTKTKWCSYSDCPWQKTEEDRHRCFAYGQSWHMCSPNTKSHQHWPRGRRKDSRIVAILCIPLHMAIDQGFPHLGPDGVKRRIENVVEDGAYVIRERGPNGKELGRWLVPDGR